MWPFSKKKEALDYSGLPNISQENMVPMPKVEPCKLGEIEGTSEPILSFIELFKTTPKRFIIRYFYGQPIVTDRVNGNKYRLYMYTPAKCLSIDSKLSWISEEEWAYMVIHLQHLFTGRKEKLAEIRRKRYMKIYGPKENVNV